MVVSYEYHTIALLSSKFLMKYSWVMAAPIITIS